MLLNVFIAINILGIGSYFIFSSLSSHVNASKALEMEIDLNALADSIFALTDCKKTFVQDSTCPTSGIQVPIKNSNNDVLISAAGTRVGPFLVRAICNPTRDGLKIQAALVINGGSVDDSSPSNFLEHPLNGNRYDWEHPKSQLLDMTNFCASNDVAGLPYEATLWRNSPRNKGNPPCVSTLFSVCPTLGNQCQSGVSFGTYGRTATGVNGCTCSCL